MRGSYQSGQITLRVHGITRITTPRPAGTEPMTSLPKLRPSRISRIEAFAEQGVSLAFPPRSWSGVREDDGGVVIAIREGEVQSAFDGFRCLLWSPVIEGATQWVDRPIKEERLNH